jgi:hypothetical protein
MWYKFENRNSIIYLSDKLIAVNPNLSTDLCAEYLTKLMDITYWDLLRIFCSKNDNEINQFLKSFSVMKQSIFFDENYENVVGALLQKSGRKNITNTYFTFENNMLLVSKISESDHQRSRIVKEKVLSGKYLLPALSMLVNKNDIEGFESIFAASIKTVFEKFMYDGDDNLLKPQAIDCITKNTIITDEGFDFFDLEYSPNMFLTKSHFIFRCALNFNKQYVEKKYWPYKSSYDLYCVLCKHLSIVPNVENDLKSELIFCKPILNETSIGLSYKELKRAFYNQTPLFIKIHRYLRHRWKQ